MNSNTDFINWGGHDCPVNPTTLVSVKLRNGVKLTRRAGEFTWVVNNEFDDIVAYKVDTVVEPPQQGHPHAALMVEYAKDALTNAKPWELWEFRISDRDQWTSRDTHPMWDSRVEYRRKPAPTLTRVVNGFTVPAPVTEALTMGDAYCVASLDTAHWYAISQWKGDAVDRRWLERGLVFLDKDHATANAKAMCGIDPKWSQK